MISICRDCRYEKSDCKGNQSLERTECKYFKEKLAINYPARIRELEAEVEELKGEIEIFREDQKERKAYEEELRAEINRLQQWTLNDKKVRHGFDLAIKTLEKARCIND